MRNTLMTRLALPFALWVSAGRSMAAEPPDGEGDVAKEPRVALSALPAPVREALVKAFPAARAIRAIRSWEGPFEVTMREGARQYDVVILDDGAWQAVEEDVELEALPAAVRKVGEGMGKLVGGEQIKRADGSVRWEIEVRVGKEVEELLLDGDGAVIED